MICCGISGNGTTRCRMPFSAQTRGIPYTMQLDLSWPMVIPPSRAMRSEEHTSELQSRLHLVCRLLLEKKKNIVHNIFPAKTNGAAFQLFRDILYSYVAMQ